MIVQSTPRKSTAKQAATARRLNASCAIAQHVLDATIEIVDDARNIIYKNGKYGQLFLIRSPKFATRYYPVNCRSGVWSCNAQNATYFIGKAQQHLSEAA